MSHLDLRAWGAERGEGFYLCALQYGQYLWQHGESARSILALARALYADLAGPTTHPLPYAAIAWVVAHHPGDSFLGNPRVSFQHQAERYRGPRRPIRQARAWAMWALIREVAPDLPGDPHPALHEPTLAEIDAMLQATSPVLEVQAWRDAMSTWTID